MNTLVVYRPDFITSFRNFTSIPTALHQLGYILLLLLLFSSPKTDAQNFFAKTSGLSRLNYKLTRKRGVIRKCGKPDTITDFFGKANFGGFCADMSNTVMHYKSKGFDIEFQRWYGRPWKKRFKEIIIYNNFSHHLFDSIQMNQSTQANVDKYLGTPIELDTTYEFDESYINTSYLFKEIFEVDFYFSPEDKTLQYVTIFRHPDWRWSRRMDRKDARKEHREKKKLNRAKKA